MSLNNPSSKAEERARYDAAMGFAKRAMPSFNLMFNSDNKLSHLIVAYLLLECAVRSLGDNAVQEILDNDPATKNIVAGIQEEMKKSLNRFGSIPSDTPDNTIYVDFKALSASSPKET